MKTTAALVLSATLAMTTLAQPEKQGTPFANVAVFLIDASLGSDEQAFAARVEQLKGILEKDKSIQRFNVLIFDVTGRWLDPKALFTNDEPGRTRVTKELADILPEGAPAIATSLDQLTAPLFDLEKGTNVRVSLLSEGWSYLGESSPKSLAASFRARTPYRTQFAGIARKPGGGNVDLLSALEVVPPDEKKSATRREAFDAYLADVTKRVKLYEGKNGDHVKLLVKALTEKDLDLPAPKADKILRRADVPKEYLDARADNLFATDLYLKEAKRRGDAGDGPGLARALTSLVSLHPTNIDVHRSVGYRLLDAKESATAVRLFERIHQQKPEEPHSYRDLARALEDAGLRGLAAVQYEILLAGEWNAKYTGSFKEVVLEEYAHMMRDAIRRKLVPNKLIDLFGERLESIDASKLQADLRVTISWNTDNTDVDLWVIEPGGEKCFYAHQKTTNGGELTQDVTQGYGPERYQMIKAKPGEYKIAVHFYSGPRANQVVEGTHVNVVVRRNAGTPQEESQRFTVILRQRNDLVDVVSMKY